MSNKKAKLLVVDDEVEYCSLLQEYFFENYDVEVANNGQEALQKVEAFQPGCVLLDVKMPKMAGVEALTLIKASHPETRVIMVSASGTLRLAELCLEQGAFDYILKPINLEELKNKIESALESMN